MEHLKTKDGEAVNVQELFGYFKSMKIYLCRWKCRLCNYLECGRLCFNSECNFGMVKENMDLKLIFLGI